MPESFIEVQSADLAYNAERGNAIARVPLAIGENEVVDMVGRCGSQKSTLMDVAYSEPFVDMVFELREHIGQIRNSG